MLTVDHARERDLAARVLRAAELRAAIRNPASLAAEAERLLRLAPFDCEVLLTWSDEGLAVAAAASALGTMQGRRLQLERASHLVPMTPAPAARWTWISVEAVLGLGAVRPWAREWATVNGGRELSPSAALELQLVS
jgi:hypothetical protein